MSEYQLISVQEEKSWMKALKRCGGFDTYHLPGFHKVAEDQGEGKPYLFFFEYRGGCASFPFLLRKVRQVLSIKEFDLFDATSVYGYPGIISSIHKDDNGADNFRSLFQKQFTECLEENNIIALFSRLNPLIPASWLLDGFDGGAIRLSETIAIDLDIPEVEYRKTTSQNHRRNIKKGIKNGISVHKDSEFKHLPEFILMYNETMQRNNAVDYYFFPKNYYESLIKYLDGHVHLFVATIEETIVCSALILSCNDILQYHLSGTPNKYLEYSPLRLLLDEVRKWGAKNGFKWLNLGGGVGSSEDSLFRFKAGFSKERFPFYIIKMIRDPIIYRELCEKHDQWLSENNCECKDKNYFPYYRAPYQGFCVDE